jgi:hypothetical protein
VATYAVYLCDPFGTRLADASGFFSLKYTRVVNGIGTLTLELPGTYPTQYIINPDGRIEVWRRLDSGFEYLECETVWLIKKVTQKINARGLQTTIVEADTPLCILREPGRFVNYAGGSAQADKSAIAADDQIKAYVRENIGSSATATRNLSAYIDIANNLSQGQSIAKSAAWRDLLTTCKELADASTQAGTYLAFDIVCASPSSMTFRTFTTQRGVDHRFPNGANPVLLSPDMGNLGEITLTVDYRDEVTYALAGGKGDDAARLTASAQDNARIGASPFGLRERFVNATNYDTTTGLSDEAAQEVRNGRPRTIFQGRVLQTNDTQYGVHWAWGDFLTAQAFGQLIDCRVEAISVTVDGDSSYETVDAWLRSNQ